MRRFIALISFMLVVPLCGCDSFFNFLSLRDPASTSWVLKWNRIAIDTSGLDHTPVQPGEVRTFGHQLGPGRSSRAMAIVHIAIFDSVNAIAGGFKSYTNTPIAASDASIRSAIAQAAHDTLVAMYPSHAPRLDPILSADLAEVADGNSKVKGIALGKQVASAILAMRANDRSDESAAYEFSDQPGKWRVDPMNPSQNPLGSKWGDCLPFALDSGD